MPKFFIHSPEKTFDAVSRRCVADELTEFALACEGLPLSPFMKSNVWIHFSDYAPDEIFMGGQQATRKVVSVQAYVLRGGLTVAGKRILIDGVTRILTAHGSLHSQQPVFIGIHELSEVDWGSFGVNPNLSAMRASAWDAPAL